MARFSERQLDEIRRRVDIVDVVGRYVSLKKSGRNWIGLCPFHQERTPSFTVRQDRQLFHCFGCKEGGDLFAFVMKIERIEFPEAVERLAALAGVRLEQEVVSSAEAERRRALQRLYEVNRMAAEYFAACLKEPEGQVARQYLSERGIRRETAERYGLGYAPRGWRRLLEAMAAKGVSAEELVRAGLAAKKADGTGAYDLFRHRLMFPIYDTRGRVVGFGGRALSPAQKAKYINTPQTEIFSKGEHLYGLYQAREAGRRAGRLILCEGYTDVTALAQAGVLEAAASLGTAFTAEQAALLRRWVDEVIIAFDADTAGRSAADRGIDLLVSAGLRVRVLVLPEGEDPDSYVRKHGGAEFRSLLEKALTFTDYRIEEAFRAGNVEDVEGRLAIVQALLPVLSEMESPVAFEAYTTRVAERLGVSVAALVAEVRRFQAKNAGGRKSRHRIVPARHTITDSDKHGTVEESGGERRAARNGERATPSPSPGLIKDERTLLYIVAQNPEYVERVEAALGEEPFVVEKHNRLFRTFKEQRERRPEGEGKNTASLDARFVEALGEWRPLAVLDVDSYIRRVWERRMAYHLQKLETQLARLSERDGNAYVVHVGGLLQQYKQLRRAVRMGFRRRVG